jgi:hypothetical protein
MEVTILNGTSRLTPANEGVYSNPEQMGIFGLTKASKKRIAKRQEARQKRKQTKVESKAEGRVLKNQARAEAIEQGRGVGQAFAKVGSQALGIASGLVGGQPTFLPQTPTTTETENESFFEKYKTPLLVGSSALALGGIIYALKPKKKKRRK